VLDYVKRGLGVGDPEAVGYVPEALFSATVATTGSVKNNRLAAVGNAHAKGDQGGVVMRK
jgi:hypothetical protein